MKLFKDIREKKEDKDSVAYLDGDKLDTFRSKKDAVKALEMAIKELT